MMRSNRVGHEPMQLNQLVDVSQRVAGTRSRLAKRAHLRDLLRQAGAGEAALVVHYLTGALPQGRIGLGPALLRRLAGGEPPAQPSLSLRDVDGTFDRIAATQGKGSQQARAALLAALFGRATASEREFLVRLILGELRQGALEGVWVDAIADVRRAVMLAGEAARVAEAVLEHGAAGLATFRLQPLAPVKPMLAQPAEDMDEAMSLLGEAALEYKLDGARVQIHKLDDQVRIYSRRQNDVTGSLPEIREAVAALPSSRLILDGEVIALREDGRPHPFQVTMRRFGRKTDIAALRQSLPLNAFVFDVLHHDGDDLIDRAASERFDRLSRVVTPELLIPRTITDDPAQAVAFLARALEQGHEGLMAKSLDSPYAAGNRGVGWLKVKQAHSLDLVVLAAEWGNGRRAGWLSNLHLGARDPHSGSFVMLGKTFKGLTDAVLEWQTRRLLELELGRNGAVVHVRPELVVEIAVNEIQTSPQYPAGMALRFARVKRYRPDKAPQDADTIDTVRGLHLTASGAA